MTNNISLSAFEIAELYHCRWRIELFFKWIKQHLRIKAFYGTSENAVKTQIWIAVSTYLLVAIAKKMLKIELSLYTILQILSVSIVEKMPIYQVLTDCEFTKYNHDNSIQLDLFNLWPDSSDYVILCPTLFSYTLSDQPFGSQFLHFKICIAIYFSPKTSNMR